MAQIYWLKYSLADGAILQLSHGASIADMEANSGTPEGTATAQIDEAGYWQARHDGGSAEGWLNALRLFHVAAIDAAADGHMDPDRGGGTRKRIANIEALRGRAKKAIGTAATVPDILKAAQVDWDA